jgi:hypothetical protein
VQACGIQISSDASIRSQFSRIYIQALHGQVHIDTHDQEKSSKSELQDPFSNSMAIDESTASLEKNPGPGSRESCHAFQQAMRDWQLLSICDVLLCENSGFCNSAAMVSRSIQPGSLLDFSGRPVGPMRMCANRYCQQ